MRERHGPAWRAATYIEAVLNHKSGQIRGVGLTYNRYSYAAEKRAALDLWAEHVQRYAGNFIIARPVESVALPEEEASELCAA